MSAISLSFSISPKLSHPLLRLAGNAQDVFRCGVPSETFFPFFVGKSTDFIVFSAEKSWPQAIKKKNLYVGTTPESWRLNTETQVMSQREESR